MTSPRVAASSSGGLSPRQRSVRVRASQLSFRNAVRLAVDVLFQFTHCANRGKALWSSASQVWLGRETFVYWSLGDPRIDIPRMVAESTDAPTNRQELREAIRVELTDWWADQLRSLPSRSTVHCIPLP